MRRMPSGTYWDAELEQYVEPGASEWREEGYVRSLPPDCLFEGGEELEIDG